MLIGMSDSPEEGPVAALRVTMNAMEMCLFLVGHRPGPGVLARAVRPRISGRTFQFTRLVQTNDSSGQDNSSNAARRTPASS